MHHEMSWLQFVTFYETRGHISWLMKIELPFIFPYFTLSVHDNYFVECQNFLILVQQLEPVTLNFVGSCE